jgi:hypothetical protein
MSVPFRLLSMFVLWEITLIVCANACVCVCLPTCKYMYMCVRDLCVYVCIHYMGAYTQDDACPENLPCTSFT